jgi:hypothetical protein
MVNEASGSRATDDASKCFDSDTGMPVDLGEANADAAAGGFREITLESGAKHTVDEATITVPFDGPVTNQPFEEDSIGDRTKVDTAEGQECFREMIQNEETRLNLPPLSIKVEDSAEKTVTVSLDSDTARIVNQALGEDSTSATQADTTGGEEIEAQDYTDPLSTETPTEEPFAMGDHIYQWCSFALVPSVFQHHGIVLDVWPDEEEGWLLKIADFARSDFTEEEKRKGALSSKKLFSKNITGETESKSSRSGCLRVYESSWKEWHKVQYGAGFWKRHLARCGTCTAASCEQPGMVRARAQFLLEYPDVLPEYDVMYSNCECVAVWCKTGTWGTLQAASWLAVTAAGQAKSALTVAGVAASTQVTVPASGLWGMVGYTTQAPLLSMHPMLVPMIAAYGIVTVGVPAMSLLRCKQLWKERTEILNQAFWESAVEHPDVFVECITHWSGMHDPAELGASR